jgi:lipoprotein-anchoring transpeptidase ErfK/SrfK
VTLARGAEGALVKSAQQALLALGFALPAGADGDYGGQTVAAVKAFQSSLGKPLTGQLDKPTFDTLLEMRPREGTKLWEDQLAASRAVPPAPLVGGKGARVLIDLSEHRLTGYDSSGSVQRVFPVASGAQDTPTDVGVKVVTEKLADPTALAEKLWPDSKGTAFGNRLIDLNWYDPITGVQTVSEEELHGTLVLESIGQNASHGCVRLTNESIEWLYQNLSVGDLVVIRE